jgi:four helix bundle protein
MSDLHETFALWEQQPPPDLFGDPIWRLTAFRLSVFLADVARDDVVSLTRAGASAHPLTQLERSIASISANISEGYSKHSGKERARYFESALGSAREGREWYRRLRFLLGDTAAQARASLLTRIIKILTVAIPRERDGESERRIARAKMRRSPSSSPSSSPSPSPSNEDED